MKLAELKEKFKNKYAVKIIAGALTIALLATGAGIYSVSAEKADNNEVTDTVESLISQEADLNLEDMLGKISETKEDVDKEETVYVITDASGKATETIVVDHLLNTKKEATITDETTLKDIENVKGKETFTQNGNKLTWEADGGEIYYQGKSDAKAPVTQTVTYFLDGKEIKAEDLKGKSGKVTIRFDYENTTQYTANIDGEDVTVCVPFVAATALTLNENFKNVEATNATVKENGATNIVLGYALPGMGTNLGIDLPEYFEVTADVENFELSTCMTMVANASQYIGQNDADSKSIDEKIDELSDGTTQLKTGITAYLDGTKQLDTGISTLKDSTGTLTGGATELNSGAQSLKSGAENLYAGATSLSDGAAAVNEGINTMLETLPSQMAAGINAMLDQLNTTGFATAVYASGYTGDSAGKITLSNINEVTAYVASNETQIETVLAVASFAAQGYSNEQAMQYIKTNGMPEAAKSAYQQALAGLYQGQGAAALYAQTNSSLSSNEDIKKLVAGAGALAQGAETLEAGAGALAQGAGQLSAGTQSLVDNMPALTKGVDMLKDGSGKLVENNPALNSGVTQLSDKTTKIVDGVNEIEKKIKAMDQAGSSYQTYTALPENSKGSVKFIYKLSF